MSPLFRSVSLALSALFFLTALCFGASPPGKVSPVEQKKQIFDGIAKLEDVAQLERAASSLSEAQKLIPPPGLYADAKDVRIAAYARLGELHTKESLAAVERIEKKAKECNLVPEAVSLELWTTPTFHFRDNEAKPIATIKAPNGTTYGVIRTVFLMGGDDFFLISTKTPDDKSSWSRPKLISGEAPQNLPEASLAFKSEGVLELTLSPRKAVPTNLPPEMIKQAPAPPPEPQKLEILIQEVLRDQDGDGWTDLEERRLGLDPRKKDTDGDGLADGQDPCPNFAPPAGSENDEETQIVQKALFTACGLTQSRFLLLVNPTSAKIPVWGYSGPVIYLDNVDQWRKEHVRGGIFMNWTVTRSGDEAKVRISDSESSMSGGFQEVFLRKIDGKWYVVKRQTGGVA
jgi:hypothetical protein